MCVALEIATHLEKEMSTNLRPLTLDQNLKNGYGHTQWHRPSSRRLGHLGKVFIICPSHPQSIIVKTPIITFRTLMAKTYLSRPRCPQFLVPLLVMFPKKRTRICQHVHIGRVRRPIDLHLLGPLLPPGAALRASAKVMQPVKKGRTYYSILPHHPPPQTRGPNHLEYLLPQRRPRTIKRFLRP